MSMLGSIGGYVAPTTTPKFYDDMAKHAETRRGAYDDLRKRVNVARSTIPAVTHVDMSARLQTIDERRHGRFYRFMREFKKQTGCGVMINTSFNIRGEPIVCAPTATAWRASSTRRCCAPRLLPRAPPPPPRLCWASRRSPRRARCGPSAASTRRCTPTATPRAWPRC
jgi:hypothetical protein